MYCKVAGAPGMVVFIPDLSHQDDSSGNNINKVFKNPLKPKN